jgi:hypothetical protein
MERELFVEMRSELEKLRGDKAVEAAKKATPDEPLVDVAVTAG